MSFRPPDFDFPADLSQAGVLNPTIGHLKDSTAPREKFVLTHVRLHAIDYITNKLNIPPQISPFAINPVNAYVCVKPAPACNMCHFDT